MKCSICTRTKDRVDRKLCSVCRENTRKQAAKLFRDNPDRCRENAARSRRNKRQRVLDHYGGKCICCGESNSVFLTLDHIDGKGAEHRRKLSDEYGYPLSGSAIIKWVRDNDYPKIFQILCWNCNAGKSRGSVCPHQISLTEEDA